MQVVGGVVVWWRVVAGGGKGHGWIEAGACWSRGLGHSSPPCYKIKKQLINFI